MRGNKREGTRPELIVRKLLYRLGYRYRTHVRGLPGRPDLVFSKRRLIVQVHGCFWHQHAEPDCPLRTKPRANTAYWDVKLGRNVERDAEQRKALEALGWRTLTVWECQCTNSLALQDKLSQFLGPPKIRP